MPDEPLLLLLQQNSITIFDAPSHENGVKKLILFSPTSGEYASFVYTVCNPVNKVVVNTLSVVEPILKLKSLNATVPTELTSKDNKSILPGWKPASVSSEALIKYCDFLPPHK